MSTIDMFRKMRSYRHNKAPTNMIKAKISKKIKIKTINIYPMEHKHPLYKITSI